MSTDRATRPALRIGEVARRTGMTVAALRAWEARYGLLTPARTAGGQRLYREVDVSRVRAVRRLVAEGWSVAGAASHVLSQPGEADAEAGAGADAGAGAGAAPPGLLDALAGVDAQAVLAAYETGRELLRAASPAQVRDALAALVRRLGGEVGEAAPQDDTVMPVDLAFGEGPPLLPRAPSLSVARMRLEAVLPLITEDARLVVHRLRLDGPPATGR